MRTAPGAAPGSARYPPPREGGRPTVLIISFDMNTDGPKSGTARKAFEDTLEAKDWNIEIRVGDTMETLPVSVT